MTEKDAKTLYQDVIVDHGHAPRNLGPLQGATHEATTHNPLCGDRVTIRLVVEADRVKEARFEARGCLIARASASMLTEAIIGRTSTEARSLVGQVEALVSAEPGAPSLPGSLEPLGGAKQFPARRACVTLAWKALEAALAGAVPRS
jgi:nitrogen fixation protein NifU and related proteins